MNTSRTQKLELINAYGGNFLIPLGDSCIGNALKTFGQFETEDIKRVSSYLDAVQKRQSKKHLFIDIGANIGTHSISALKDHGYERVYAVEPSLTNYRLLTANICLNGLLEKAVCINAAASDHEGIGTLFRSHANCGDYRLGNNPEGSKKDAEKMMSHQIQGTDLQDVLCWIDTQGHEIPILKALMPLLDKGLPIVFEFWPYGMEQQGGCFEQLTTILSLQDLQIGYLGNSDIELLSLEQLRELWSRLRNSDTGEPEGASYVNIVVYKHPSKEIISSDEAARIAMTLRCEDSSLIPKVNYAGEVFHSEDFPYQLMHNGLKVASGGYYGDWMRELIQKLQGHHEPQEEKVFHEINKRASISGLMIELGCFWAYYSLWFLKDHPKRKAVGLEPDPNHLNIAQKNSSANQLGSQFSIIQGLSSEYSQQDIDLTTESGSKLSLKGYTVEDILMISGESELEILHCDAQGAEAHVIDQAISLGIDHRLRFCIISTHAYEITGDPLTHQKCIEKLLAAGAHIIAEHDVHESFSGDGLIAASFSPEDKDLTVELSCNRYSQSLFPSPAVHLSNALQELNELRPRQQERAPVTANERSLIKRITQFLKKGGY
jgi:FkbM family methyltransferase